MKRCHLLTLCLISALATPLSAEETPDTADSLIEHGRELITDWQQHIDELPALLADFQAEDCLTPADGESPMPTSEEGKAIIESDGALLFDVRHSRLVYVNGVRLNAGSLQLRASRQLQIQLERRAVDAKVAESNDALAAGELPFTGADGTAPGKRGQNGREPGSGERTDATPSAPESPPADPSTADPYLISTTNALVDTETNRILLSTSGSLEPIVVENSRHRLEITPSAEARGSLLGDEQGNILAEGSHITVQGIDSDGKPYRLDAEHGIACYSAAARQLSVVGPCRFSSADGTLSCRDGLTVTFDEAPDRPGHQAKADKTGKAGKGFMGQFADMKLGSISQADARGDVRFSAVATAERPSMKLSSQSLHYDARLGECLAEGDSCRIEYGNNTLSKATGIHLAPNGDITALGQHLEGSYERPAPRNGAQTAPASLIGSFSARDELRFTASDGCIRTRNGLTVRDDETDFSCDGPVTIRLGREGKAGSALPRKQTGGLNLAIAGYNSLKGIEASRNVRLVHTPLPAAEGKKSQTSSQTYVISGEDVRADLEKGTASVRADDEALVSFGANSITVTARDGANATEQSIIIDEQGDICATGGSISAAFESDKGPARARCLDLLRLTRADNLITTGSEVFLESPQGRFTARGPVELELDPAPPKDSPSEAAGQAAQSEGGTAASADTRPQAFAHLTFNYVGLRRLHTEQGGTARTPDASLQCSGLIDVTLVPYGGKAADPSVAPIDKATLSGDVAVLYRDASGRLVRATGDRLEIDAAAGEKVLSGRRVTLSDSNNIHISEGAGAAVRIDRRNNARITGSRQSTTATNIQSQTEQGGTKK